MNPSSSPNVGDDIRSVLSKEARRHATALAALFATVALALLGVGLLLPRHYEAASTIRVEENPLLKTLARAGLAEDERVALAREAVFGRKVMDEILQAGGWLASTPAPTAIERDRLIERIMRRTQVMAPGAGLVRIAYTDDRPERALDVARRFADLFASEVSAAQEQRSRAAFDFVDAQVRAREARDPSNARADDSAYRELVAQREKMRIAMELDAARQGLLFHVVEPAMLPTTPQGLRLSQLMLAGLALGILVPLAWLFVRARFDPRVRSAARIERLAQVPVLASVSPYPTPAVRRRDAWRGLTVCSGVALVLLAYAAVAWLHLGPWP